MTLQFHVNSSWNESAEQFVGKEVTGSVDEPIGHVLLREAWANQTENLRSSIVLAVAAAEVGFKQFASIVLPDSDWLLESIQSPPLIKMLTELFPWTRLNVQIGGQTLKPPA
jgi:hypothetical protein